VAELWQDFVRLLTDLGQLVGGLAQLLLTSSLLLFWLAWCLWGVNWKKAWAVLAAGAWAPVVLLLLTIALVWSQIAPSECTCLGFTTVPNFWWQLGEVGLLAAVTLLCGWLQGYFGWTPVEVDLEPPAPADHGHAQGHH
jgi:hypothetical protein